MPAYSSAFPTHTATPSHVAKYPRFGETVKFLPVAFILVNILGLYLIYTFMHLADEMWDPDPVRALRGKLRWAAFNVLTLMLSVCYAMSILVHPGTVPDESRWEYKLVSASDTSCGPALAQEHKKSGDRRHCKWCAKFKPDRCHHCRVCRTCILKMDHHCPWIYNCVGFRNHKYFFLLLLYSSLASNLIFWTMLETVWTVVNEPDTPFISTFLVLFGEALAGFLGLLVTVFFVFHIWLTLKAMTTIEFCEKQIKRAGYNTATYDRGILGNLKAVLGENVLLWLLPIGPPQGDGLEFAAEETRLGSKVDEERGAGACRRALEAGKFGAMQTGQPCATAGPAPAGALRTPGSHAEDADPEAPPSSGGSYRSEASVEPPELERQVQEEDAPMPNFQGEPPSPPQAQSDGSPARPGTPASIFSRPASR